MTQSKIRHEWFQTPTHVSISIFVKSIQPSALSISFQTRAVSVSIRLDSGSEYLLEIDPTFDALDADNCTFTILSTQVQIKLVKKTVGLHWPALESSAEHVPAAQITQPKQDVPPSYPTSSKKPAVNWDKIGTEPEESPQGEAALNSLFQQIYANATEDTRKAMVKSFVESGGTCLSTNWNEVGSKKVEITPPDGMEARSFEK